MHISCVLLPQESVAPDNTAAQQSIHCLMRRGPVFALLQEEQHILNTMEGLRKGRLRSKLSLPTVWGTVEEL